MKIAERLSVFRHCIEHILVFFEMLRQKSIDKPLHSNIATSDSPYQGAKLMMQTGINMQRLAFFTPNAMKKYRFVTKHPSRPFCLHNRLFRDDTDRIPFFRRLGNNTLWDLPPTNSRMACLSIQRGSTFFFPEYSIGIYFFFQD